MKLYHWDGKELTHEWTVDFYAEGLGRSHQMRFGAYALYGKRPPSGETKLAAVVQVGREAVRGPSVLMQ